MAAGAAELVIADGGRSDYTIVIAAEASDSEKHAAKELRMFLEQISEAKLPIAADADEVKGPMILVGRSERLDELELKVDFEALGDEGFVMRTAPPHVVLSSPVDASEAACTRFTHSWRTIWAAGGSPRP